MYNLINVHIQPIMDIIQQDCGHVTEYDWLIQNLNQCATQLYQDKYKDFWRLNVARLSENYRNVYFKALQGARGNPPDVGNLAQQLYGTPTRKNEQQSLQFSFATKLVHMVAPTTPIYDSFVAAFYFFKEPASSSLEQRVAALAAFHTFLSQEYNRILANNLLAESIQAFRQQFNPQQFTNEKVIDSLLWAYVKLMRNGGATNGTIIYR